MNLAVGSSNPVKKNAVRLANQKYYENFELYNINVDSEVPDQPIGFDQILKGAYNRAEKALIYLKEKLKLTSPNFGIGIEAGLSKIPIAETNFMDFQFCIIMDEQKEITIGSGIAFEYPESVIKKVFSENLEIGYIMGDLAHNKNLKREEGAIGYLSRNTLKRIDILREAVICALLPRLNSELYNK